jgi:glycine/serine hydroxymethyltransferase
VLVAGYSAYPRNPNFAILAEIAHDVGATFMVDMAHFAGLVAGKVLVGDLDPVPHADVVTSTTHKSLRGPRGGLVLCTEEYAPYVDKGCPMVLGGPMPHVMAAKAVALSEARQPSFATYATQIVDNARALADGLLRRGHGSSPEELTTTLSSWTWLPASASPAVRPRPLCSMQAWSPIATQYQVTPTVPGTPRAFDSVHRR